MTYSVTGFKPIMTYNITDINSIYNKFITGFIQINQ